MVRFKDYIRALQEGTKDVHDALKSFYGDNKGTSIAKNLLSTRPSKEAEDLHNTLFKNGQHHVELGSVDTSFPDKIRHHVESNGDSVDHDGNVTTKNAYGGTKTTTIDKYLGKSLKSKSKEEASDIQSELTNWRKNKDRSNTRLVLSRHPADIASASTGTHWTSCADLRDGIDEDGGLARDKMENEIKNGTLIALHVHKDAKPNEDGSYDSKDIIGRTLVKLHHGKNENTLFRERKSYGAFPKDGERKVDSFLDKNTPRNELSYQKNSQVYNDDAQDHKYIVSKIDINNPEHAKIAAEAGMTGDLKLESHHIDSIIKNAKSTNVIDSLAFGARDGKIKLEPHHIDHIIKNKNSEDANVALIVAHNNGNLKLEPRHIDAMTKNKLGAARISAALVNAHNNGKLKLEPHHIDSILNNKAATFAHEQLVNGHVSGKIKLEQHHIDTIVNNLKAKKAHKELVKAHKENRIKLTDQQKEKLRLRDGYDI